LFLASFSFLLFQTENKAIFMRSLPTLKKNARFSFNEGEIYFFGVSSRVDFYAVFSCHSGNYFQIGNVTLRDTV